MKTIFDNRVFDVQAFANMPRCTGEFKQPDGSGCLLTALWHGFGIRVMISDIESESRFKTAEFCILDKLLKETDQLAWNLGLDEDFTGKIVANFDSRHKAHIAVNLMFELIERLPNKVEMIEIVTAEQQGIVCAI